MDMHIVMIGHMSQPLSYSIYVYINILNVSRNSYLVLVTNVTVRCMKYQIDRVTEIPPPDKGYEK